jgi:hypothetical protein
MKIYNLKLLCFVCLGAIPFLWQACTKAPDFPVVPVISNLRTNKDVLLQGFSNQDTLWFFFDFTDGDGDLGSEDSLNIFVIDDRDNNVFESYRIPFLPIEGAKNGIEGSIRARANTTCCIFPDNTPPCTPSLVYPRDTVLYSLYIVDRAGNKSNILTTNPISILCE